MQPKLIHEGLSGAAVKARRPAALNAARRRGYTIARPESATESEQGYALLNSTVPGLNDAAHAKGGGQLVVARKNGTIAGAAWVGHDGMPGMTLVRLRALATHPEHRRQGIGLALLHEAPRLLEARRIQMIYGSCPEAEADFYGRAGFAVTFPGQPLLLPGNHAVLNSNTDAPCWFYRRP
nr:N-Acyltransferase superfamily [Kocuria sp.]